MTKLIQRMREELIRRNYAETTRHAPKHSRRLPTILTPDEVPRLIDSARNLFHYAMLLTVYLAGRRRSELCKLKVISEREWKLKATVQ